MNNDEYRAFYEIIKEKGSDFCDILKDPKFKRYTLSDLEDAYVYMMDHIRFLCTESGGCEEVKQIKDIYRLDGRIVFDVLAEDSNGKKTIKEGVILDDYRSKLFILVKDYEFFLKGKLNMLNEIKGVFSDKFEDICSDPGSSED